MAPTISQLEQHRRNLVEEYNGQLKQAMMLHSTRKPILTIKTETKLVGYGIKARLAGQKGTGLFAKEDLGFDDSLAGPSGHLYEEQPPITMDAHLIQDRCFLNEYWIFQSSMQYNIIHEVFGGLQGDSRVHITPHSFGDVKLFSNPKGQTYSVHGAMKQVSRVQKLV
jgi:hypothetical protein